MVLFINVFNQHIKITLFELTFAVISWKQKISFSDDSFLKLWIALKLYPWKLIPKNVIWNITKSSIFKNLRTIKLPLSNPAPCKRYSKTVSNRKALNKKTKLLLQIELFKNLTAFNFDFSRLLISSNHFLAYCWKTKAKNDIHFP